MFTGSVKLVILTKGKDGASAYSASGSASSSCPEVKAVDTTGAGDAFIGSFLYSLSAADVTVGNIADLTEETMKEMLHFSNTYCGKSVQKEGAIASYPTKADMGL